MARRTKEDALATRDSILDAAELLFIDQGVSKTTLQHIAAAAGVTRGAVYWHFLDKGALFNALMERAKMPLEEAMRTLDTTDPLDPLHDLREYALCVFRLTKDDPRARRVFEISSLKMEMVGELNSVRVRRQQHVATWNERVMSRIAIAQRRGQVRAGIDPADVALGLWVLVEGLIRNWLIEPQFDLVAMGARIIDTHLLALRT